MNVKLTLSNITNKIKMYIKIIRLLWKYRAIIVAFVKDGDKLVTLVDAILVARLEGKESVKKAQEAFIQLLDVPAITFLVNTTETTKDNENLEKVKKFANNNTLFKLAWRVVCGDSSIGKDREKYDSIIDKLRKSLPWNKSDETKEDSVDEVYLLEATGAETTDASEDNKLSSNDVEGIGTIISVISLVITIYREIRRYQEKKKEGLTYE